MGAVTYNQSGYVGCSRSVRACQAEKNGERPLSRAVRIVARAAGVTQKRAREALLAVGESSWHHVSKYANAVDFYQPGAAIAWLRAQAGVDLTTTPAEIVEELADVPDGWESETLLEWVGLDVAAVEAELDAEAAARRWKRTEAANVARRQYVLLALANTPDIVVDSWGQERAFVPWKTPFSKQRIATANAAISAAHQSFNEREER